MTTRTEHPHIETKFGEIESLPLDTDLETARDRINQILHHEHDWGDIADDLFPTDPDFEGSEWIKDVYVATVSEGVFFTDDFVDNVLSPAGTPTWTAVNTGIDITDDIWGFAGDPFEPAVRQYVGNAAGIFIREDGGNWVSILTLAEARTLTGMAAGNWGSSLVCNMNILGWVACMFGSVVAQAVYLLVSFDYGASWEARLADSGLGSGNAARLAVGAFKGTSIYDPGTVLYSIGKFISTYPIVSVNGGISWSGGSFVGGLIYPWLIVDPNDQSIMFASGDDAGSTSVTKHIDYLASRADYDGANEYGTLTNDQYSVSLAMDERKTVRIGAGSGGNFVKTTHDDATSWIETTPQYSADYLGISIVLMAPHNLYLLRPRGGVVGDAYHTLWASEDESATMIPKSGIDPLNNTAGTSIPYNHGGIIDILQVWTLPGIHDIGGPYHSGTVSFGMIADLVGTGAATIAAGTHAAQHQDGGADEISVTALSGLLADDQHVLDAEVVAAIEAEATLDLTGDVTVAGGKSLAVDIIEEKTGAAGVTIDSVVLKDGAVTATVVLEHHTADDTLTKEETGSVHTNLGEDGAMTLTLPQDATAGCNFKFAVMTAQELRVDPGAAGAIYINGAKQTDDKYITADDEAESVMLVADGNGDWVALFPQGTWGVEA